VLHRFISEDPRKAKSVTNRYAYVGNNPTNFIDPSGAVEFNVGGHHVDARVSVSLGLINVQFDLQSKVSFSLVLPFSVGGGVDFAINPPANVAGTLTVGAGRNLGIGTNFEQGSIRPRGVNVNIGKSIGFPIVLGVPLGEVEVDPYEKIRRITRPKAAEAGELGDPLALTEAPDILDSSNQNALGSRK